MTDSIKARKNPPDVLCFKENDIVRLTKRIEQRGTVFKKGSVGDVGDVQVSALTGRVGYSVVIYQRGEGTAVLVDPEDIVAHNPANRPQYRQQANGSAQPPGLPSELTHANEHVNRHANSTEKP